MGQGCSELEKQWAPALQRLEDHFGLSDLLAVNPDGEYREDPVTRDPDWFSQYEEISNLEREARRALVDCYRRGRLTIMAKSKDDRT